jgi:hypothetical protein
MVSWYGLESRYGSHGDKMRLDRLYSVYVDYAAQLYNEEYQMLYLLSATITIDTVGLS